jgi:quinoprotein glucose dehydrogenase
VLATDVKFGPNGGIYLSDWVEGWGMTGKGRIYRVHDQALDKDPLVLEAKRLLAKGMTNRSPDELAGLLEHPDMRVRQEAQFALADLGGAAIKALGATARGSTNQLARIHAIWAIGQIDAKYMGAAGNPARVIVRPKDLREDLLGEPRPEGLPLLVEMLRDYDPEIEAQCAKVLGDRHYQEIPGLTYSLFTDLLRRVSDSSPRWV